MIEKSDAYYFLAVVVIAAVLASAWVGMTNEPVPLQVQKNEYAPTKPPVPAMPTYDPQYVPGSYADTNRNSTKFGKFTPAPAPVVVTTAPLPTITTIPTERPTASTTMCCNNARNLTFNSIESATRDVFNLLSTCVVMLGIMIILFVLMQIGGIGNNDDAYIEGVTTFIIAALLIVLILPVTLSVMQAQTATLCVPC